MSSMSQANDERRSRSTLWRQATAEMSRVPDSFDFLEPGLEKHCDDVVYRNVQVDDQSVSKFSCTYESDSNASVIRDSFCPNNLEDDETFMADTSDNLHSVSKRDMLDDIDDWLWPYVDSLSESGSASDTDEASVENLKQQIRVWAVKFSIQQCAISSLLKILIQYFPHLPRDARTLLKVPTDYTVKPIRGGEYCHVGLLKGLYKIIERSSASFDHLELQINVDGIPLFRSSSTSLWPILCLVKNVDARQPFVVGIFSGKEKPGSASEFLSEFVSEANDLMTNGLQLGDAKLNVKLHSFVCDAPARAFMKGIKSHSGYSSCEKCTIHGEYAGKVIFPSVNDPLRTDEGFRAMIDEEHHLEPSALRSLHVGLVSQFGLDYMHLACLGVMRRFLLYWKGPVGPLSVRLGRNAVLELSKRVLLLASYTPVEFARKPRAIDDILRWKATEFRLFVMYTGPFVLHGILNDSLYNHFMLLFTGLRILSCKQLAPLYCEYANELLVKFVKDAGTLYGKEALVYNVHSLIHLADDVKQLGCLDEFSAFVFENKLGQLKKLVRKPQHPIQQIVRRLDEQLLFGASTHNLSHEPVAKFEHNNGPVLPTFRHATQYKQLLTNKFTLSLSIGNNCIMTAGGFPALVKNIVKNASNISLICVKFRSVSDAFAYPLSSSKLSICKVETELPDLFPIDLKDVVHKCVCWPVMSDVGGFVVIPLLH